MNRVVIVEDEHLTAEKLKRSILNIDPDLEVLGIFDSVIDAAQSISSNRPDLIFLDVELSDGSGFDLLDQIPQSIPIIFTTAHSEHALRAFKKYSVDFLLKPIDDLQLEASIRKFKSHFQKNVSDSVLTNMEYVEQLVARKYKSRFLVRKGKQYVPLLTEEIAYFFADHDYVWLVTKTNNKFLVNYTLENLSRMMDPELFFRLNRKIFASLTSIEKITMLPKSKLSVLLTPQTDFDVTVSAEKSSTLKAWLRQ